MNKIFVPAKTIEDWKQLLPPEHWKDGFSAKTLALCWNEAVDFPESVRNVFKNSEIDLFQNVELLFAFPEYKVPLPGGVRPSQNDIFILAKGNCQLISITVEGKVSEGFGDTVNKWRANNSKEERQRLKFLLKKLQLTEDRVLPIPYQLLHRTASAIIEAENFGAKNALMLVHSFSQNDEGFDHYWQFSRLFNSDGKINSLVFAKNIRGIDLYLGWVKEV
jgi:hypothetical protein